MERSGRPGEAPLQDRGFDRSRSASAEEPRTDSLQPSRLEAAPLDLLRSIRLICFYLPQFHPIPENDAWWGKGFTEWRNVAQARPMFPQHYQPHVPADLGFYDLRLPEVRSAQAAMAAEYGIHGFCYHHYWFHGKQLLEAPFQAVLDSGQPDFPFCLCWANENWSRRWDGSEHEILIAQAHSDDDDRAFIRGLLPAFRDRRYIRVGRRPLLVVYRTDVLPNPARTAEIWREEMRKAGEEDPYLCRAETFQPYGADTSPASMGFDAALEFPPHALAWQPPYGGIPGLAADFTGTIVDYRNAALSAVQRPQPGYPLFRGVIPAWDNTARLGHRAAIFVNSSPELYEQWLTCAINWTLRHHTGDRRLVFINAWNEWAEGCHLEPDLKHGTRYLAATADALRRSGRFTSEVTDEFVHLLRQNLQLDRTHAQDHAILTQVRLLEELVDSAGQLPLPMLAVAYLKARGARNPRLRRALYYALRTAWRAIQRARALANPRNLLRHPASPTANVTRSPSASPSTDAPIELITMAEVQAPTVDQARFLASSTGLPLLWQARPPERHDVTAALAEFELQPADAGDTGDSIEIRYDTPALDLLRIADALLFLKSGMIRHPSGRFLAEVARTFHWSWNDFRALPGVRQTDNGPRFSEPAEPVKQIEGLRLQLQNWVGTNYCHWHLDCLPGVLPCLEAVRSGEIKLLTLPLRPWQARSLERLGVPATAIDLVTDEIVRCRDLIVPSALSAVGTSYPPSIVREVFHRLAAGGPSEEASPPTFIYVSRQDSSAGRRITNEEDLIVALAKFGFKSVVPGWLTLDQQIAIFSRARMIVGPHGAGLANIGYAPAGCIIVEIVPDVLYRPVFRYLAALLRQRYVSLSARVRDTDRVPVDFGGFTRTNINFTYAAPIDRVIDTVRAAMTRLG